MRILLLDNYDSFTYNLLHLAEKCSNAEITVKLNDQISLSEIAVFDKIILSPGPGLPHEAGIMPQVLQHYHNSKSILGVCLGWQAIGEFFGASLKNLETVYHGIATPILVEPDELLFQACPKTFSVGRYHSWVVNEAEIPDDLIVTARDQQGLVMAGRHKHFNVAGLQFHPESILSEYGEQIISNWLQS